MGTKIIKRQNFFIEASAFFDSQQILITSSNSRYTFSVSLLIQKVLKLSNRGNLTISNPLAFTEGLSYFFELFYRKRRIFENSVVFWI
jgi:hypothetical protein